MGPDVLGEPPGDVPPNAVASGRLCLPSPRKMESPPPRCALRVKIDARFQSWHENKNTKNAMYPMSDFYVDYMFQVEMIIVWLY